MKKHPSQTRILLVDNHPVFCQGMCFLLEMEADLMVCGEAYDAASALELFDTTQPDLAIVDISLGGRNGIELIADLRKRDADLSILVVSQHSESMYAERAIRAGAKGYVTKREAPQTIVEAIRTVLRGGIHLSEEMKTKLLYQVVDEGVTSNKDAVGLLSPREFEVFRLIGQGKSTREIANQFHLSINTVDVHRWRVKEKLQLKGASELTCYAAQWVQKQNESL